MNIVEAAALSPETGYTACRDCGLDRRGSRAAFRSRYSFFSLSATRRSILGSSIIKRAANMPHIAPLRFNLFKRRFDNDPYIHDGPRMIPKTSTYQINHQLLPIPLNSLPNSSDFRTHFSDKSLVLCPK